MILTDREIKIALEQKQIFVDPMPKKDQFSSTSLDLTLGSVLSEFIPNNDGIEKIIDPSKEGYNTFAVLNDLTKKINIDSEEGYKLKPAKLILAWTKEHVNLPIYSKIAARVEGKSSLARHGLAVHMTAPTIHSGFNGIIQLEIINNGSLPILLRKGMKICQLIFEQTIGTPVSGYEGRFQDQTFDK